MKKYLVSVGVAVMAVAFGVSFLHKSNMEKLGQVLENCEALTSDETSYITCIPDENSVCVDGDYGIVLPKHYYSQH